MIARELISYYIPSVSSSKKAERVLELMDEHKVSHLPVVDNGVYHGIISDTEIYDLEDTFISLKKAKPNLIRPYVNAYSHIYEIIATATDFRITAVPVLDDKEEYVGLISLQDLAVAFAKITNAHEPGGIVILGLNVRDYSMVQVAQIVESENAKILSSYISSQEDSLKIDLTLKINLTDLSAILAAFDRFNYEIKASYHESRFDEDLQRRYDQFLNYLNI